MMNAHENPVAMPPRIALDPRLWNLVLATRMYGAHYPRLSAERDTLHLDDLTEVRLLSDGSVDISVREDRSDRRNVEWRFATWDYAQRWLAAEASARQPLPREITETPDPRFVIEHARTGHLSHDVLLDGAVVAQTGRYRAIRLTHALLASIDDIPRIFSPGPVSTRKEP
ncbi:hypothetical protein [Demequina salsinemoris]|uniref:hypothetical protein n=1 Tax=Demequina salsinemoris TaxID=577470 RepID=UPI00128BF022|nr:hypothetical protein [Demequina salsinemoris]